MKFFNRKSILIFSAAFVAALGVMVCLINYLKTQSRKDQPQHSNAGIVTTLAGSGLKGIKNGTRTAAKFNRPRGIAVDSTGNVYVADYKNFLIRKITPGGTVTTLARGFNGPMGVAVGADGIVYVADCNDHLIRKVGPKGIVKTLAGSRKRGDDDGTRTSASFNYPFGVAADADGNVYVADTDNNLVRKINPDGEVTTLAGQSGFLGSANGTAAGALFNQPTGIAVDLSGNVYVADSLNNRIRKITPDGKVSTLAGSRFKGSQNGTGTYASFNSPEGVAVDTDGNVYVADTDNNLIRKINPDGDVTTLAGSKSGGFANGKGMGALFDHPWGIAVDTAGNVYVADCKNNLIRKIQ